MRIVSIQNEANVDREIEDRFECVKLQRKQNENESGVPEVLINT